MNAKQLAKNKGYDDDCTPNTVAELATLMKQYTRPHRKALLEVKEFLEHIEPKVGEAAFNEIYSIVTDTLKIN